MDASVKDFVRAQREEPPPRAIARISRMIAQLEGEPPSRARESGFAWLFLALAEAALRAGKVREGERAWLTGYSYARTARDSEAFAWALALEEVRSLARNTRVAQRRKHRR